MEITRQSKLFDVLQAYPFLEEQIIRIAPPFQNLKNPVLRRTVGQLATIEKVAQIGGIEVTELVNNLRRRAGQPEIRPAPRPAVVAPPASAEDPDWIAGEPTITVDGAELLRQGEVPLQRINELLRQLDPPGFILLLTDFEPTPLIEAMLKQGRETFQKPHPGEPGLHLTYIR